MKNINVTVTALLIIGFTGLTYGETGKCNGMQNSNMKNKSGMMQGNQGMMGGQGMMQNQQMGKCNGSMQGNKGMMQKSKSQQQIDKVKKCVNAATTLQEIQNCKVGMMKGNKGMQGNQGMMQNEQMGKCNGTQNSNMKNQSGMMQGNQGMKCGGQAMMNNQ